MNRLGKIHEKLGQCVHGDSRPGVATLLHIAGERQAVMLAHGITFGSL